ncbi:hypothetical protein HPP92_013189 [Vanilla planifolia]|uniref:Uncharacterized protein n=1 Tax=Vanilla planifolia TaxID=51239 RepID=A0A835QYK4_VANPL|nr:hypothetical protein HPP92_013189 [Vanilla planifolia]
MGKTVGGGSGRVRGRTRGAWREGGRVERMKGRGRVGSDSGGRGVGADEVGGDSELRVCVRDDQHGVRDGELHGEEPSVGVRPAGGHDGELEEMDRDNERD